MSVCVGVYVCVKRISLYDENVLCTTTSFARIRIILCEYYNRKKLCILTKLALAKEITCFSEAHFL